MQEFLLWRNCTNKCDFCWQHKLQDPETYLNKSEMLESIDETISRLDEIDIGDDVLLVGGEILASYHSLVDDKLHELFDKCVKLIKKDSIRYLYINTNLIYENRKNLIYLLESMKGLESRLKFTTSFDLYGRFNEKGKKLFLDNLAFIRDNFPEVNIVVNSIITKQLIESDFNFNEFQEEFKVRYINFIPYIPVEDDRCMDVDFMDIVKVLAENERRNRGAISFYINDFDMNQNKKLYEFRKSSGYVECTSKYSECGHNENFKKVLDNKECFICKLKDVFG